MPIPFLRYALLIRRLRWVGRTTLPELVDYVRRELPDTEAGYARRTFQRDLEAIPALFGIEISCDRSTNTYFISADARLETAAQLLETLEVKYFLAEAATLALEPLVHLEPRRPTGTEHLRPLLRATRERVAVRFQHQKYWEDAPTRRTVWPLGLKQSLGRWYLLAHDPAPGKGFRTFGLDRLIEVEILATHFPQQDFDAAAYFRDAFGATRPDDDTPPVEIELAFDWQQGRYVEDYPLHPSQQKLFRNQEADEIRIRLRVFWTHEVLMMLLAYGDAVEVLAPAHVRAEVARAHLAAVGPRSEPPLLSW